MPSQPGIIVSSVPNSTVLSAHKLTRDNSEIETEYTIISRSKSLSSLLDKAPTFSFSDRIHWTNNGKSKIVPSKGKRFKAGIYLDDLPKSVPRPKLAPVTTVGEATAASAVSTSSTAVEAGERKRKRLAVAPEGASETNTLVTRKTRQSKRARTAVKEECKESAAVVLTARAATAPAAPAPAPAATAATATTTAAPATAATATTATTATKRPKGLEINMMPATFRVTGGRLRKRPARFEDDEMTSKLEKKGKGSNTI